MDAQYAAHEAKQNAENALFQKEMRQENERDFEALQKVMHFIHNEITFLKWVVLASDAFIGIATAGGLHYIDASVAVVRLIYKNRKEKV